MLTSHGHRADQIGTYTYRQVILYYEAALRRENNLRVQHVVDANAAAAGGSVADEHVKKLLKTK